MKQLISQSKKSSSSDPRPFNPIHPAFAAALGLTLAGTLSCRNRDVPEESFAAATEVADAEAPARASSIDLLVGGTPVGVALATLDAQSCQPAPAQTVAGRLEFDSPFGRQQATFSYAPTHAPDVLQVKLGANAYRLTLSAPLSADLLSRACEANETGKSTVTIKDSKELEGLRLALAALVPVCQFTIPAAGQSWRCTLPEVDASQTIDRLQEVHKRILTRWSRHPYLLTRRVAVTSTLGQALTSVGNVDERLDGFCKIAAYSLPAELPVILRSKSWQKSVCEDGSPERVAIAKYGLKLAVGEIVELKDKLESSTRLGTLRVAIPFNKAPSRDFWVSLKPMPKVVEAAATPTSQTTPTVGISPVTAKSLCWNPFFGNDAGLASAAIELGLATPPAEAECERAAGDASTAAVDSSLENYVTASIMTETEFAITNGRGKLLRLPEGQYEYTLRVHSEGLLPTPSETAEVKGIVTWGEARRPNPVIREWTSEEASAQVH